MGILEDIQATVNDTNARVRAMQAGTPGTPSTTTTTVPPVPQTTTTTTLPPVGASALKGFNIGNDQNATPSGTPYNKAQNDADLAYLKGRVARLRVAFTYGHDANDLANLKKLALAAKAQGFSVMFGITAGLDGAYWPSFLSTDMLSLAGWCETNKIDEFSLGNEESWNASINQFNGVSAAQVRSDVRNAVAKVKAVYHGSVVYCDSQGVLDAWISEGIGNLDRIYFNVYDTLSNFQTIINKIVNKWGKDHAGLSEWAAQHGYAEMLANGFTDATYAAEIANREKIVEASGLPSYAFTWRMNSDGKGWEFVLPDGTHRPGLDKIIGT